MQRLPATLELTFAALFLATVLGIPLGLLAALDHNGPVDHLVRLLSVGGLAIASFWLAIMLQLYFSMDLDILPLRGRIDVALGMPPRLTGSVLIDSLLAGRLDMFIKRLPAPGAAGGDARAAGLGDHRSLHPIGRARDAAEGLRAVCARRRVRAGAARGDLRAAQCGERHRDADRPAVRRADLGRRGGRGGVRLAGPWHLCRAGDPVGRLQGAAGGHAGGRRRLCGGECRGRCRAGADRPARRRGTTGDARCATSSATRSPPSDW